LPGYPDSFYRHRLEGPTRSAREVVPFVMQAVGPRSVVDVGCGVGTWLAVFQELGVTDVCGVDGDWLDRGLLRVPLACFVGADLTRPVRLGRTFDLVVSLEVAEHLPAQSADDYVASLTALGPVVLFSAAVPFQGGVRHVNEQWPDYWAGRFARHGYVAVDCVRKRFWDNPAVSWWYAQNLLFLVRRERLADYSLLAAEYAPDLPLMALVHPRKYLDVADPANLSLGRLRGLVAGKVRGAVGRWRGRRAGLVGGGC
jgi:SAM-dependent methyltransferase